MPPNLDASNDPIYAVCLLSFAVAIFILLRARKWAQWFEDVENRIVKQEAVGKYFVSTVFLGIDHSIGGGRPILFETMVFQKDGASLGQDRYCTWGEALTGHKATVKKFQKKDKDK